MKRTQNGFKKCLDWIEPSFDDFDEQFTITKPKISRRQKAKDTIDLTDIADNIDNLEIEEGHLPWIDQYAPVKEIDLAVNKKKIQEVKEWIFEKQECENSCGVLLLSGPSGSGKTAVVNVLTKLNNYHLKEWINPVAYDYEERSSGSQWDRSTWHDSQTQQFKDFLVRANRYNSINMMGQESNDSAKRIVYVEDLPNFVLRDPSKLHEIIRRYSKTGRSPLIFVISDNHNTDSTVHKIFPNNIQQELNITHISFNAASATSLKNAINNIVKLEKEKSNDIIVPTKDTIDLLIASSNGDIRSCINSLQFFCTNYKPFSSSASVLQTKSTKTKQTKTSKSRRKPGPKKELANNSQDIAFGGRDNSLFLFRSLGKILYCKRTPLPVSEKLNQLPINLKHLTRDSMQENPENVFERTQVTSDMFLLYLHQNYPTFYNNVEDLSEASLYVSDADILSAAWDSRYVMSSYCSSISMRGIMFANSANNTATGGGGGGWKPLHKPEYFQSIKTTNTRHHVGNTYFHEMRHYSKNLFCEVLPYMKKIKSPVPSAHKSFINELSSFSGNQSFYRTQLQVLTDSLDLSNSMSYLDSKTDVTSTNHTPSNNITFNGDGSDDSIEDFDDDD